GYFIIAIQFLFDQSILVAVYELVATIMVTAAMVGMNQLHTRVRPLASLRLAGSLVVQALPFAIVLFLFFPRIAPLWTVPLPTGAKTGISDHMTPGDIAKLTQSDELAFRVVFEDRVPANRDLYWRGLVYSNFESGTWSMGAQFKPSRPEFDDENDENDIRYEVLLEPTMSSWLFALDTATAENPNVARTLDYRLVSDDPVMSVFRYNVLSRPGLVMDERLISILRVREKKLPEGDNPRIREFARTLYLEANKDVPTFIEAVLSHIRTELFSYTLQPPVLRRENSIDEFWFDTRAGFCTHYAGAFVFMLRSVGIPTRMVGGYQGGEINPISNHLVVRQYDAHAWAEVWLEGRGW
ncbi:MAG: transglutaminaseTgpA domain-containing protein, partial [Pseudomonadales bacterium]